MTCRPCLDTYIHTYKQTINQYKQIVIIHQSIYLYMAADGKTPPNPPTRGGGGNIMCICNIFVCIHNKNDMPTCLDTYIHTYKQTINQYKQIVIIHQSIETYSYTYTWLQMVRPPPTHPQGGGGAGTLCVYVISLFAYTIKMTCRPAWTRTYIHTNKP